MGVQNKTLPFNPALFWDVDVSSLDPAAHGRFIIERIVSRGDLEVISG
jgi:hypothetical protein